MRTTAGIFTANRPRFLAHVCVWCAAVAAQEGARALYKGIVPSLAGVIPYVGIDFMAFSWLSREWAAHTGRKINRVEKLAIGALAGVAGQTVAYPLDLVRRRLQLKDVGNRSVAAGVKCCCLLSFRVVVLFLGGRGVGSVSPSTLSVCATRVCLNGVEADDGS